MINHDSIDNTFNIEEQLYTSRGGHYEAVILCVHDIPISCYTCDNVYSCLETKFVKVLSLYDIIDMA